MLYQQAGPFGRTHLAVIGRNDPPGWLDAILRRWPVAESTIDSEGIGGD